MRTLIENRRAWLISKPPGYIQRWSLALAITAGVLVMLDTVQLLAYIHVERVVAVPYFAEPAVQWWVVAAVGAWTVGTLTLVIKRARVALGWLAPAGLWVAGLADRQTFTDVILLVTIALAMHWWSSLLADRAPTSHLRGVPLRVLQVMISVVLGWATFAKLNPRFLSGAVLSVSFNGPISPPELMLSRDALVAMAIATVLVEGFLAGALWIDTLRNLALVTAVAFHLFIVAFFGPAVPLAAFAIAMGSGYLLFAGEPWQGPSVRISVDGPEETA